MSIVIGRGNSARKLEVTSSFDRKVQNRGRAVFGNIIKTRLGLMEQMIGG